MLSRTIQCQQALHPEHLPGAQRQEDASWGTGLNQLCGDGWELNEDLDEGVRWQEGAPLPRSEELPYIFLQFRVFDTPLHCFSHLTSPQGHVPTILYEEDTVQRVCVTRLDATDASSWTPVRPAQHTSLWAHGRQAINTHLNAHFL